MRAQAIKELTLIQGIIYFVFVILQLIFFDMAWSGHFYGIGDITFFTSISSFVMWPAVVILLISIYQLYLLKIKQTLIFGLIGNTLAFYVMMPSIGFFPYFSFHVIIPLFTISGLFLIFYSYMLYLILIMAIKSPNKEEITLIKKTILKLGTQFTRLEVREISEDCQVDHNLIIKVIIEMISNNEIHAEYFKSSKTVAFNQEANIEEM